MDTSTGGRVDGVGRDKAVGQRDRPCDRVWDGDKHMEQGHSQNMGQGCVARV